MSIVTSKDGTQIAYDKQGSGPALILVDGALCYRGFGPMPGLAELLAPHFTVYTYDRRGRGESSNAKPFSVQREVEDIDAIIQAAGGSAYVYGISSGACLAMEAALKLAPHLARLAMYEPPYNSDDAAQQQWKAYRKDLAKAIGEGRNGDAVVLFMKLVGTPDDQVNGMRQAPMWPMFEAVAPTLEYDAAAMGDDRSAPTRRASGVNVPTLVMDGGANLAFMPFMHDTASALARSIPHAQHRTLEGQTHDVKADVIAPVLVEFFNA
ncbi:MAG TPA: alpha/beta hydrolase [Anaerolineales bacterium]|nr:alpha/beta hydrolase [Anaerolineales bacterium]